MLDSSTYQQLTSQTKRSISEEDEENECVVADGLKHRHNILIIEFLELKQNKNKRQATANESNEH